MNAQEARRISEKNDPTETIFNVILDKIATAAHRGDRTVRLIVPNKASIIEGKLKMLGYRVEYHHDPRGAAEDHMSVSW